MISRKDSSHSNKKLREYHHNILCSYLQEHNIIHQSSSIDTPQQIGAMEYKNKNLIRVPRSIMIALNVSNNLEVKFFLMQPS